MQDEDIKAEETREVPTEGGEELAPAMDLWITITPDLMSAAISGKASQGADRRQVQVAVTNLLRENNIKHGLVPAHMHQAMDQLCRGETLDQVTIALGTAAEPGQDAKIELLVAPPPPLIKQTQGGGQVDFRDRGALPVVEQGTPLATLTPAVPGKPGRNVLGQLLQPTPPRMLRLKAGRNVTLEDEGRVAVATAQGILRNHDAEHFEVLNILEVPGDVDFKVGHINFPGLVRVHGAILPDFRVRAHSLEVEALDNRSKVEVSGDLKVLGGIMGAEVLVGGKLSACYIRQSKVLVSGDCLVENEIVASEVVSNGKIMVTTSEGRIVNSQVAAIRGVSTGHLVCSGKGQCVVRLGMRPEYEQKLMNLRRQLATLEKERSQILEALQAHEAELGATEGELREILAALNDPGQQAQRENLIAQVQMIKPLRQTLKEGVENGRARLEDIQYETQHITESLAEMEKVLPVGAIWLDVRGRAETQTEIRGPRAALVLDGPAQSFSAREQETRDKATGSVSFIIKLGNLRAGAA